LWVPRREDIIHEDMPGKVYELGEFTTRGGTETETATPTTKVSNGEKMFNGLTPQFSTSQFTVFVISFRNTFLTFIIII